MSDKTDKRDKSAKDEKIYLRERVNRALDIPPDVFAGESLIELRGRNSVSIGGGGKILLYTPEEIRIELRRGCVCVVGQRLCCTSYHAGSVGIDGYICEIRFER